MSLFIHMKDLIGGAGQHGFNMYTITVVTIHDKHVSVLCGISLREMSGLVREYLTGGGYARGVDGM